MRRLGVILIPLMLLSACHPDPFSMKPEVNVQLPDEASETETQEEREVDAPAEAETGTQP